jgi:hypothetical protein
MDKESSRIYTGTFYIVGDKIVYTLDTDEEDAIDHFQLWELAVPKLFPHADYESKQELKEATYGADRGRVVFKGQRSRSGAFQSGLFNIYGTPGCQTHLTKLKQLFGLNKIDKLEQFDLEIDFKTDPHYKVVDRDKRLISEFLRATDMNLQPLKIAGWSKESPDPRKVRVTKID